MNEHRFDWKDVKKSLFKGKNQNLVGAYVERGQLVIVTERYSRGPRDPGELLLVSSNGMRRTSATELNTIRRNNAGKHT